VFIFIAILNIPFAVHYFIKSKKKAGIYLIAGSALFFLAHQALNEYYYQKNYQHGAIYEYQSAVDALINRPVSVPESSFRKLKIPLSGEALLHHWFWIDSDVFTIEKIKKLSQDIQYRWSIPKIAYRTVLNFWHEKWYLLILVTALMPYLICFWEQRSFRTLFLVTLISTILFLVYFAGFRQLPHRLFYPFLICQFLLLAIHYKEYHLYPKRTIQICFFLCTLLGTIFLTKQISINNQVLKRDTSLALKYINSYPDKTFLIEGHGIRYEGIFSFVNPALDSRHNVIPTNWVINTPLYQKIFEQRSISNLLDIIDLPNTILVNLDTIRIIPPENRTVI
jgi:hypothetical protein